MAAPTKGMGGIFSRFNGVDYDVIGEVVSITPPSLTKETIETTGLNPTNGFHTYIGGIKDGGEVSVVLNFDPAVAADAENQALLKGDVESTTDTTQYKIEFASAGPNIIFDAVATGFEVSEISVNEKVTATFTCKVSGKPTWADS